MNITTRSLMLGLLCLGALNVRAAGPTTNLVQNISLSLTSYSDGDTFTNKGVINHKVDITRAGNADILKLLGTATTNTFSKRAKLILVTPLPDGDSSILVQDGTNKVDVTGFFTESDLGPTIEGSMVNTNSGMKRSTEYGLIRFALHDRGPDVLNAHFDATGFVTVNSASVATKARVIIGESHAVSAALAGAGDFKDQQGTHTMLIKGTLTVTGGAVVITP